MARRMRPSPALIVALIALFVSIGGVGYAASKIGTNDIQNGAVTNKKLAKKAVKTRKINKEAVKAGKIAPLAVKTSRIADLAVTTEKLADLGVTTEKLADDAVSNAKLQDDSVRAGELGGTQLAVNSAVPIAANGTAQAVAACPAGTQVLSGGGTTSSFGVHLVSSFQAGNGWIVAYQNTTAAAQTITAAATCLSA